MKIIPIRSIDGSRVIGYQSYHKGYTSQVHSTRAEVIAELLEALY